MRVIGKAKLLQKALLVEDGNGIEKEQRRLYEGEQTEHIYEVEKFWKKAESDIDWLKIEYKGFFLNILRLKQTLRD